MVAAVGRKVAAIGRKSGKAAPRFRRERPTNSARSGRGRRPYIRHRPVHPVYLQPDASNVRPLPQTDKRIQSMTNVEIGFGLICRAIQAVQHVSSGFVWLLVLHCLYGTATLPIE